MLQSGLLSERNMLLDINTIGREKVYFDRELELPELEGTGGEAVKVVRARLSGEAMRAGRGVAMRCRLEARLEVPCSRCLEAVSLNVDAEIARTLIAEPGEEDLDASRVPEDEDDDETLRAAGGKVRLEEIATEQIYLSLPLKPICRPDCGGLCPKCGANRNLGACGCRAEEIDPRLAPLLEFRRRRERD